jgi:prepilin-type processing-associated H-X9-DG protein
MSDSGRSGWTLLETVVVTMVAGTVVALVMVGLSLSRERSRRNDCQNHLRQLGLAMQSYHQVYGMLPPAVIREDARASLKLKNLTSTGVNYSVRRTYANWAILLLPQLGHEKLAVAFNQNVPVTDPANVGTRMTELTVMKCPSDGYSRADNACRIFPLNAPECTFSRGNYAINAGVSDLVFVPGKPWSPRPNGLSCKYTDSSGGTDDLVERVWGSGVAGFNKSFSVQEFQNGLSNLVGIDEVRAGLTTDDVRGVWTLGVAGASITLGHGLIGDASGPNCRRPRSDDIIGCNQVHEVFGEEAMIREGMPCASYVLSEQATARSVHPSGVNALMMDGSAKFFVNEVDLSIWHAVHSRETREVAAPASCDALVADDKTPPSPEPVHSSSEGIEFFTNSIGMKMANIPAGEFIMGLPDAGEDREDPLLNVLPNVPPHRVRITREFSLGVFEVTQGQYVRIMGQDSIADPPRVERNGALAEDRLRLPVANVSWIDAVTFCNRLSALPAEKTAGRRYRLPTEAEWEYACRAGSTRPFVEPTGETADASGFNVRADSSTGLPITNVGSYPPNAFGLHDMRGNVLEWCADWFAWDYYKHSPKLDPRGPSSGVLRVVRGADWRFTGMGCHFTRFDTEPWRTSPFIGFRVLCEMTAK